MTTLGELDTQRLKLAKFCSHPTFSPSRYTFQKKSKTPIVKCAACKHRTNTGVYIFTHIGLVKCKYERPHRFLGENFASGYAPFRFDAMIMKRSGLSGFGRETHFSDPSNQFGVSCSPYDNRGEAEPFVTRRRILEPIPNAWIACFVDED